MNSIKTWINAMELFMLSRLLLIIPTLLLPSCTAPDAARSARLTAGGDVQASGTRVVLLGTGNPNANPDRSGPALAIVVNSTAYLVDCGPGVVRRASAAHRAGVAALKPKKLDRLFITHLHTDHTLGLPDVIFTPWVLGRKKPLEVYGPPGTRAMVDHIVAAYEQDVRVRLDGLEPANDKGHRVIVHEITPGVVYRDENVIVTAFPVVHGSWKHAFGFRFDAKDRSIVISGDTTPTQSLIDHAKDCDVLVHEVYSKTAFARRPDHWQRYHAASHTSTTELAAIARQVRPGLLVLYHQLFWGATDEDLLREIRSKYDGPVSSGADLDVY